MGGGILKIKANDVFTLTTNANGDGGTWDSTTNEDALAVINELFQKVPYCPVEGNVIKVTVTKANLTGSEAESFKITTECTTTVTDGEVHK
jgi:hypothetical protein